jgi:hypothetical protein
MHLHIITFFFLDGTHKTNKEDWELIVFSIQDMNGKQHVVMSCWAPNTRAWLFNWLFQTAVPAIMGTRSCTEVRLVITDGDSQEFNQLDVAIQKLFINAKRRRCGWHLINRGWRRNVGALVASNSKTKNAVCMNIQNIKNWLYSFMREIESEGEYIVSKLLLLRCHPETIHKCKTKAL